MDTRGFLQFTIEHPDKILGLVNEVGDHVICENCGYRIVQFTKQVGMGGRLNAEDVKDVGALFPVEPQGLLYCAHCHTKQDNFIAEVAYNRYKKWKEED